MTGFTIRPARVEEAGALSALCKRSKAHWGYDAEFMRLSDASLTISPALIETGRVLVAQGPDGTLLGMASLEPLKDRVWDLLHLFIDAPAIGHGVGRELFTAICEMARREGAVTLSIMADPHAVAFYERVGAKRAGEAPSDAIPGRMLPMLEFALPQAR
jgi:GNAT superfamily N-acetyltransferase